MTNPVRFSFFKSNNRGGGAVAGYGGGNHAINFPRQRTGVLITPFLEFVKHFLKLFYENVDSQGVVLDSGGCIGIDSRRVCKVLQTMIYSSGLA